MQRPGGQGTAFSIDSLIGTPPPRSGHLLYTGYPMFMPYRPLVLPQALSHAPLQSGLPPLAPLASFAGRLTNTFCASLGQAVPSMVALTTALPSFSEPPDGFYPPQELPPPRATPDAGCRRGADGLEAEELPPSRDKGPPEPPLHFPDPFPGLAGKSGAGPSCPAESSRPTSLGHPQPRGDLPGSSPPSQRHLGAGGLAGRSSPGRQPGAKVLGAGVRRAGQRESHGRRRDLPPAALPARPAAFGPSREDRTDSPPSQARSAAFEDGRQTSLASAGPRGRRGGRAAGHRGRHGGTGAPRPGAAARSSPRSWHSARASEAEGGGASHDSVRSPPRPHRSWSRSPYRSRLVWRGVRLVPSGCLPASPCCDYRLSKVSPKPAPQG